jgi:hypothetical protein
MIHSPVMANHKAGAGAGAGTEATRAVSNDRNEVSEACMITSHDCTARPQGCCCHPGLTEVSAACILRGCKTCNRGVAYNASY